MTPLFLLSVIDRQGAACLKRDRRLAPLYFCPECAAPDQQDSTGEARA